MRSRLILVAAIALLGLSGLQHPALAAAHGGEGGGEGEKGTGDVQYVDISPVALPVVYERRLINYVFVTVRVHLAPNADAPALRAKEPFFRDALVKLGHRQPFTRLDDFASLDEGALRRALAVEATRIAGPRMVTSIEVLRQDPKRRTGLPIPPQRRAPGRPAPAAAH